MLSNKSFLKFQNVCCLIKKLFSSLFWIPRNEEHNKNNIFLTSLYKRKIQFFYSTTHRTRTHWIKKDELQLLMIKFNIGKKRKHKCCPGADCFLMNIPSFSCSCSSSLKLTSVVLVTVLHLDILKSYDTTHVEMNILK